MAITVDWITREITIPKADLDIIVDPLYELDMQAFRLQLHQIEASEEGIAHLRMHNHVLPVDIGSISKPRVVLVINGYNVTFEDGPYLVETKGGDNNMLDLVNHNQVSVRAVLSTGTVEVASGGHGFR